MKDFTDETIRRYIEVMGLRQPTPNKKKEKSIPPSSQKKKRESSNNRRSNNPLTEQNLTPSPLKNAAKISPMFKNTKKPKNSLKVYKKLVDNVGNFETSEHEDINISIPLLHELDKISGENMERRGR